MSLGNPNQYNPIKQKSVGYNKFKSIYFTWTHDSLECFTFLSMYLSSVARIYGVDTIGSKKHSGYRYHSSDVKRRSWGFKGLPSSAPPPLLRPACPEREPGRMAGFYFWVRPGLIESWRAREGMWSVSQLITVWLSFYQRGHCLPFSVSRTHAFEGTGVLVAGPRGGGRKGWSRLFGVDLSLIFRFGMCQASIYSWRDCMRIVCI